MVNKQVRVVCVELTQFHLPRKIAMDLFKTGMKGPTRPAPAAPGFNVNRYSPVTNWNDDPFGADLFEPTPQHAQKKKPPPRPPPPRVNKQPDVPVKPTHFIRRPTVLTSLLSRKSKTQTPVQSVNNHALLSDFPSEIDPQKMFPKCDSKNVQMASLIDLSSPPSSPTFTTRSSSDGLSVNSFGSDATSSTNNHNTFNGGSTSQAESGFEDDFDLFLNTRKPLSKEDTFDDFSAVDPFSPQAVSKPPVIKKPVVRKSVSTGKVLKGPTIIRAKPARPKPPDSAAILKSTFGDSLPLTMMNLNITTPIQKVNGFDSFDTKSLDWDVEEESSPERESSPPMPCIPPPPPPPDIDEDLPPPAWPADFEDPVISVFDEPKSVFASEPTYSEPHAIALFDYSTDHPEDLCFTANSRIKLIRRVDHEWLYGSLRSGQEGLFPSSYVEVKVPLSNDATSPTIGIGTAIALYDFEPDQPGDLRFSTGDKITILHKINDEWYSGDCNGLEGQFPANYVQMNH